MTKFLYAIVLASFVLLQNELKGSKNAKTDKTPNEEPTGSVEVEAQITPKKVFAEYLKKMLKEPYI